MTAKEETKADSGNPAGEPPAEMTLDEKIAKAVDGAIAPLNETIAKLTAEKDEMAIALKTAQEANKKLGGTGVGPTKEVWVKTGGELKLVPEKDAEKMGEIIKKTVSKYV